MDVFGNTGTCVSNQIKLYQHRSIETTISVNKRDPNIKINVNIDPDIILAVAYQDQWGTGMCPAKETADSSQWLKHRHSMIVSCIVNVDS